MARPAPSPSAKRCRPWGRRVTYVSDAYTVPVLRAWAKDANIVDFPIASVSESKAHAATILERVKPSLLISIERCGRTKDDTYLNMRSRDISGQTARDRLPVRRHRAIGGHRGRGQRNRHGKPGRDHRRRRYPARPADHRHRRPVGYRQRVQLGRVWSGGRVVATRGT